MIQCTQSKKSAPQSSCKKCISKGLLILGFKTYKKVKVVITIKLL